MGLKTNANLINFVTQQHGANIFRYFDIKWWTQANSIKLMHFKKSLKWVLNESGDTIKSFSQEKCIKWREISETPPLDSTRNWVAISTLLGANLKRFCGTLRVLVNILNIIICKFSIIYRDTVKYWREVLLFPYLFVL